MMCLLAGNIALKVMPKIETESLHTYYNSHTNQSVAHTTKERDEEKDDEPVIFVKEM